MINKHLFYIFSAIFLLLIMIIVYLVYITTNINNTTTNNIQNSDKVCMTISEFNNFKKVNSPINKIDTEDTIERDRKVLDDDLFPPLNRGDTKSHTNLSNSISKRQFYVNTQETGDTFRLVAYVSSTSDTRDSGNNNWKLFARQKDRHSSEFYMIPTDNTNDLKISINNDNVVGNNLRDIYDIPQQISFNSPLLNSDPYNVVEVPKADLARSADYI